MLVSFVKMCYTISEDRKRDKMKKKTITYYELKRKSPVRYSKPLYITVYKKNKNDAVYFYSLKDMLRYFYEEK